MANINSGASPSVNITIEDASFIATQDNSGTSLGVSGETLKGRAFTPVKINSYDLYKQLFGGLNPCKFPSGQPIYETSYIAKQFLTESNNLYVTRVLGLSGYDAGDAWSIKVGGGIDIDTIATDETVPFTVNVEYVDNDVNAVLFSNDTLQSLYDEGRIDNSIFGLPAQTSGDTISMSNKFLGDCNGGYIGARFNAVVTNKIEQTVCITGSIIGSTGTTATQVTQTCTVNYVNGTVTEESTFIITVVNAIVIVNTDNNGVRTVRSGTVQINGGTITHNNDGSINFANSTIYLPDGTILTGNYKICDLEGNDALYDCTTVQGVNYTISTGNTTTVIDVIITDESVYETEIASGIVNITFSGDVTTLMADALADYEDMVVCTLRSYGSYGGDEILNFNVKNNIISIEPVTGDRIDIYEDFKIQGTLNGDPFEYIVSFDQRKKNYIGRVFGDKASLCCPPTTPLYIEELYQTTIDNYAVNGYIDCVKPTVCYNQNLNNYKTEYRGAKTPWFLSELRGNKLYRLFRFHTFSDGNAANSDVKVSIENIKLDKREFDVVVRAFNDTDRKPVVLERYSRVNLSVNSNNYIGLMIGTVDGEYPLKSKYIMIEMAAECLDNSFPAGFEGYPVRDYGTCLSPDITYNNSYTNSDRIRNVYLGISDTTGYDQDFFDFKGLTSLGAEWSDVSRGFHMDKDALTATIEGTTHTQLFVVGSHNFRNETEILGTTYEKLYARKFTAFAFGGFDGWDIHRTERTNTDDYTATGRLGRLGFTSNNFDAYIVNDDVNGITSDYYAYLKGILTFNNPESVVVNLLATPNVNTVDNTNLVEATIEMIEEDRCDAFYIVTTPDTNAANEALSATDLVDNIEGLFDSPYVSTYSYWGQYIDSENNTRLFIPPTAEVVRLMARTDKTNAPWYIGAGVQRGGTDFTNIRKKVRKQERDVLAEGRVNSILADNGKYYIFGNRTLQIADSLLTNINVVRMLLYLRSKVSKVGLRLLFEPADTLVVTKFERDIEPILRDLRDRRGIYQYEVQMDRSRSSLELGEMNGIIVIYPTPALKAINLTFRVTRSGAEVSIQ